MLEAAVVVWVLVVNNAIEIGYGGSITFQEFNSKATCESAIEQIMDAFGYEAWLENKALSVYREEQLLCVKK